MGKINWLEVLFWVVMSILFIMILSMIFGNSATNVQVYLVFFSSLFIVTGYIINSNNRVMGHIVKLNREVGEIKIQMKHGFINVKDNMDSIRENMVSMKEDTALIKKKVLKL